MGPYASENVFVGPSGCLCVLLNPFNSLKTPYASLIVLMGPYMYLCVCMGS